ncbi:hypothetical protein OUZ56_012999 [Daphnia magna]|uniref:Uncharacterized protein n=1 Tax=Daphnia magna TaxID=35525 RepID=A0ABQ9Z4L8_9CRUS|nr:hypothetical protein OUZ56_012999 [Daphnia magna]
MVCRIFGIQKSVLSAPIMVFTPMPASTPDQLVFAVPHEAEFPQLMWDFCFPSFKALHHCSVVSRLGFFV